jgi:hypothetical protein
VAALESEHTHFVFFRNSKVTSNVEFTATGSYTPANIFGKQCWQTVCKYASSVLANSPQTNIRRFLFPAGNEKQDTMKMAVFWVVAPCSLVEVYQRFGGACCLHHQGDAVFASVNVFLNTSSVYRELPLQQVL